MTAEQLNLALSGDRAAVTSLVEAHLPRVYRLSLRISRSSELAEEATQETFVRVLKDLGHLRDPERLTSWILTIAANTVRGLIRRRPRELSLDHEPSTAVLDIDGDSRIQQQALAHAVDRLNPSERELFLLHHLEGLALDELARARESTTPAIKSRMHRIRQKVRSIAEAFLTEQRLPA